VWQQASQELPVVPQDNAQRFSKVCLPQVFAFALFQVSYVFVLQGSLQSN
jgi:hypothetical protein